MEGTAHRVNGYRIIDSLEWATWTTRELPKDKLKGRKAKGMTYERLVKKNLTRLLPKVFTNYLLYSGEWIAFFDKFGRGFAQPDVVIELSDSIILIEVKLTQTDIAEVQTKSLYLPLVKKLIPNKPVFIIQICKYLRYLPSAEQAISEVAEVLSRKPETIYTLHESF